MQFQPYPINTYNLKQLAEMYSVALGTMAEMVKEAGIEVPDGIKFRRLYFPVDVQKIFDKFGTPSKEIN